MPPLPHARVSSVDIRFHDEIARATTWQANGGLLFIIASTETVVHIYMYVAVTTGWNRRK
eukprot:scaffold73935_cov37-Prasinocladus_malaysianus.AAC.1